MPFALIGLCIGFWHSKQINYSSPNWLHFGLPFLLVVFCMIFARSAAMAFNRYIDRAFDYKNPRTATREIPSGIISEKSALYFTIVNSILFVCTSYFINQLCFLLSPLALLIILGYSYTKRFTYWCHFILGLGLSLAPIGAYLAVTGRFHLLPILFGLLVLSWVSGFDIIYALQDEDFDKNQNLQSIPAFFGKTKGLLISSFLHILSAILLIIIFVQYDFHWIFLIGAIIFIAMLYYQHQLVKPKDLSKIDMAFATTNGIASLIFSVFVIADILKFQNLFN
jgi:4-hydroxybenzoate polyprenyltransferase